MSPDDPAPDYLTTREVADLLRIRERKVYELARSGGIPCVRVTGKLLFPRRDIDAWLAGGVAERPAEPRKTMAPAGVIAGSHDPLLDWAIRESGSALATFYDGSLDGLERVSSGAAIAAGMHVFEPDTGTWNTGCIAGRAGDRPFVLIEWARRRQGLIVAPRAAEEIGGVAGLRGRTLVPRQPSAGGGILLRHLLDRAGIGNGEVTFLDDVARTEIEAAAAVSAGRADAAPGLESMARQFGLAFLPTMEERFDLLVDRRSWFEAPIQRLAAFARTPAFAAKADELGGYDLAGHGTVHWNGP